MRPVTAASISISLSLLLAGLFAVLVRTSVGAVEAPRFIQKDGRFALLVEGKPYLILGGQIYNSRAWPSELPQVWNSIATLHANTVEAPSKLLNADRAG